MIKSLGKDVSWLTCGGLALVLAACGGGGGGTRDGGTRDRNVVWEPPLPVTGDIRWEGLGDTSLSRVAGAEEDNFSPDALVRAAQEIPTDEVSVRVVRNNEGKLVHELREGSQVVLVPSGPNEQVPGLALFTNLIPGIEPDLSSYPHELLGIWARDGQVRAFWSRSPSLEPFETFPSGSATYTGDAVGLHAAVDGATAKFLAKVKLDADFQTFKVKGTVSGFRLSDGSTLDDLTVNLVETDFSKAGEPFAGNTTAGNGAAGSGKWGARWSDSNAGAVGGTFGFAADDRSVTVLGAFTGSVPSSGTGNDDDSVATRN